MTEPDFSRNGRRDLWPRGKVLGGSSSINAMVYMRGQASDYDLWAALGNRGWSYEEVLPYFRRSETNENGANRYHGGEGPLCVSNLRTMHPLAELFIAAGERRPSLPLEPRTRHPGFHKTNTVDCVVVLEGEIWAMMELCETLLKALVLLIRLPAADTSFRCSKKPDSLTLNVRLRSTSFETVHGI
jgi:hypothetical protein